MTTGAPVSARLVARLAGVLADPAPHCPPDMTGLAPLPPAAIAPMLAAPGRGVSRALAIDMGLAAIDVPADLPVRLRTEAQARIAAAAASAPLGEIDRATRLIARATCRPVMARVVMRRDREAFEAVLGPGAIEAATRRAPGERSRAALEGLAPADASPRMARVPDPVDPGASPVGPWSRPHLSATVARLPPMLRHAHGALHAFLRSVEPALGAIHAARLGRRIGAAFDVDAPRELTAAERAGLADLLARGVPQWSMSTA